MNDETNVLRTMFAYNAFRCFCLYANTWVKFLLNMHCTNVHFWEVIHFKALMHGSRIYLLLLPSFRNLWMGGGGGGWEWEGEYGRQQINIRIDYMVLYVFNFEPNKANRDYYIALRHNICAWFDYRSHKPYITALLIAFLRNLGSWWTYIHDLQPLQDRHYI